MQNLKENFPMQHVLDSIAVATYNALDDLGLDISDAESTIAQVIAHMSTYNGLSIDPISKAQMDYTHKVRICGGPKPATIQY